MGNNIQFYFTNLFESASCLYGGGNHFVNMTNALDNNNRTFANTVGSSEGTSESLYIYLGVPVTIDTIFLLTHNLKNFTILYSLDNVTYSNFSTPISQTTNALTSNKFSFNAVSVLWLRLTTTNTISAGAEKQVGEFIATQLNFELADNPKKINPTMIRPSRSGRTERGKLYRSRRGDPLHKIDLEFSHFKGNDFIYLDELALTGEPFIINLCGDTDRGIRPYTWADIKKVEIVNDELSNPMSAFVHTAGYDYKCSMEEVL